jgi:hypothetical protein
MGATVETVPPSVAEIFNKVEREPEGEADWTAMSLSTFQRDWDNAEDAIYDNWRELYGVPAR